MLQLRHGSAHISLGGSRVHVTCFILACGADMAAPWSFSTGWILMCVLMLQVNDLAHAVQLPRPEVLAFLKTYVPPARTNNRHAIAQ